MVILASNFEGCPRNLQQTFVDSMVLVQEFGKPQFFITMTCNTDWPEIQDNLRPNEKPCDRPDIVVKVFQGKLKELMNDIKNNHIFGTYIAWTYVIEFQKRGLPHAHILVWIHKNNKIRNGPDVDKYVSAEIPDQNIHPRLFEIVKKFMIHGPCGSINTKSSCMDEQKQQCTKNFPKAFNESTDYDTNGYPIYKRPNNGRKISYSKSRTAHNRFVVPYNPYLSLKYNCHINVEICSTILCVKYSFKYCYTGHDCANIKLKTIDLSQSPDSQIKTIDNDEIKQYVDTRYVCPPEACHRIFEFIMHGMSHAIYRLAVHDKNEQNVYFKEGCEHEFLDKNVETTLALTT